MASPRILNSRNFSLWMVVLLLKLLVLKIAAVSDPQGSISSAAAPLFITQEQGNWKDNIAAEQTSHPLSKLREVDRPQRQIEFKGTYQDLPMGIPEEQEEDNDTEEPLHYFALRITLDRPAIDVNYRDPFHSTMTYFPPEVIPIRHLQSSKDSVAFLTDHEEEETQTRAKSLKKKNFVEYSPFYIPPSEGADYEDYFIESITKTAAETTKTVAEKITTTTTEIPLFVTSDTVLSKSSEFQEPPLNSKHVSPSSIPLSSDRPSNYEVLPQDGFLITGEINDHALSYTTSEPFISTYAQVPNSSPQPLTTESNHNIFIVDNTIQNSDKSHKLTHPPPDNSFNKGKALHESGSFLRSLSPPLNPYVPPTHTFDDNKPLQTDSSLPHSSKTKSLYTISETKDKHPTITFDTTKPISEQEQQESLNKGRGYPKTLAKSAKTEIPGIRGQDYPAYQTVPITSFNCVSKQFGGYYADPEARCQVFHICLGKLNAAFLCPTGTLFNQKLLVCDWWYNVKCLPDVLSDTVQSTKLQNKSQESFNPT